MQEPTKDPAASTAKKILGWSLFLLTLAICLFQFWYKCPLALCFSLDTGWLIKVGQSILEHGIPHTDTFSWTHAGRSFVAYQWLFEVIVASLFKLGGLWTLGLASCLLSALLYFFFLPRIWLARGIAAFLPFAFLSIAPETHWFSCRPALCSLFLELAFIHILERHRTGFSHEEETPEEKSAERGTPVLEEGNTLSPPEVESAHQSNLIWLLPVLMAFWVNLHAFWVIGLATILVYLPRSVRQDGMRLGMVFIATLGCTLLNPYGLQLYSYIWTFVDGSQFRELQELFPAYNAPEGRLTLIYLAVAWIVLVFRRKTVPIEGFVLLIAASLAAFLMNRFEAIFKIISWEYLGLALASIDWSGFTKPIKLTFKFTVAHLSASLIAAGLMWHSHFPDENMAWAGFTDNNTPVLDFVVAFCNNDKLFNEASSGSWLISRSNRPVFVDTRYDMYPKQFLQETQDCMQGKSGWEAFLRKWNISAVLTRDEYNTFYLGLLNSRDWKIVVDNTKFSLWVKDNDETDARLAQWNMGDGQLQLAHLPPEMLQATIIARGGQYLLRSRSLLDHNQAEAALETLKRASLLIPNDPALQSEYERCLQKLDKK